jgi:hypothetical protein
MLILYMRTHYSMYVRVCTQSQSCGILIKTHHAEVEKQEFSKVALVQCLSNFVYTAGLCTFI